MIVFAVKMVPGRADEPFLSEELLQETQAQVMTPQDAQALGFSGFADADDLRLVVVTDRDAGWVEKALERAPHVVGYDKGNIDM